MDAPSCKHGNASSISIQVIPASLGSGCAIKLRRMPFCVPMTRRDACEQGDEYVETLTNASKNHNAVSLSYVYIGTRVLVCHHRTPSAESPKPSNPIPGPVCAEYRLLGPAGSPQSRVPAMHSLGIARYHRLVQPHDPSSRHRCPRSSPFLRRVNPTAHLRRL